MATKHTSGTVTINGYTYTIGAKGTATVFTAAADCYGYDNYSSTSTNSDKVTKGNEYYIKEWWEGGTNPYLIAKSTATTAYTYVRASSACFPSATSCTLNFYSNGGTIASSPHQSGDYYYRLSSGLVQRSTSSTTGFAAYAPKYLSTATSIDLMNVGTPGIARTGYHIEDADSWIIGATTATSTNTFPQTATTTASVLKRLKDKMTASNPTVKMYANWHENVATANYYANGGTITTNCGVAGVHQYTSTAGVNAWYKIVSGIIQRSSTSATTGFTTDYNTYKYTATTINLTDRTTMGVEKTGYHVDSADTYIINSTTATSTNTISQAETSALTYFKSLFPNKDATIKLYLNWKNNTYKLKYDLNGGYTASDYYGSSDTFLLWNKGETIVWHEDAVSYAAGTYPGYCTYDKDNKIWKSDLFEKPGYTLKEWNTQPDGSGTSYAPNTAYTLNLTTANNPTEENAPVLYAIWEQIGYTVEYDGNGGTVPAGGIYPENEIISLPLASQCSKPSSEIGNPVIITYDTNGGSTAPSPSVGTVTTIIDYILSQWDDGDTEYYPGVSYTVTKDVTFKALWAQDATRIIYPKITLSSSIPTKTGYKFLGWDPSSTATTPTYLAGTEYEFKNGTTLYAVWEKETPKALVKVDGTYVEGTPYIKVNGTWVEPTDIYVKVDGDWTLV